jgi:hypothetical protein
MKTTQLTFIIIISTFLAALTSCSPSENPVSKRMCNCSDPLIEFANDSSILALDKWYDNLDYETKSQLQANKFSGKTDGEIDKKYAQFLENIEKGKKIQTELQSCINAVNDEFEEEMKDEEFKKEVRIHLREICPETAKKLGI